MVCAGPCLNNSASCNNLQLAVRLAWCMLPRQARCFLLLLWYCQQAIPFASSRQHSQQHHRSSCAVSQSPYQGSQRPAVLLAQGFPPAHAEELPAGVTQQIEGARVGVVLGLKYLFSRAKLVSAANASRACHRWCDHRFSCRSKLAAATVTRHLIPAFPTIACLWQSG